MNTGLGDLVLTLFTLESVPFLDGQRTRTQKEPLIELWLLLKWDPLSTYIPLVDSGPPKCLHMNTTIALIIL